MSCGQDSASAAPCVAGFERGADGGCHVPAETGSGDSGDPDTGDSDSGDSGTTPTVPDVVVIVLDTGRWSLFNDATMPALMSRVPMGVSVENMTTTGAWTRPTTASLMTGLRMDELGEGGRDQSIPSGVEAVEWRYRSAGYGTYLNTANEAISLKAFTRQFERAEIVDQGSGFGAQASAALEYLAAEERPAFVWLQAMELHVPYDQLDDSCAADVYRANDACSVAVTQDPDGNSSFDGDAFIDMTAYEKGLCSQAIEAAQRCTATRLDHELDSFLQKLGENTVVAVTTDHGEGWLDPFTDHNWSTNPKLTRGFFLLLNSHLAPQVVPEASQVDLMPTLLRESGIAMDDLQLEGVPLGEPQTTPLSAWFCEDTLREAEVAVWADGLQLARHDRPGGNTVYYLYDTVADPEGDHDLLQSQSLEEAAPPALRAEVDAKMERTGWVCSG